MPTFIAPSLPDRACPSSDAGERVGRVVHAEVQARERQRARPARTAARPGSQAPSTRAPPRTRSWRARWGRTAASACRPAAAGPRSARPRPPHGELDRRVGDVRRGHGDDRAAPAPPPRRGRRAIPAPPSASHTAACSPSARTRAPRARPPACGRPCARGASRTRSRRRLGGRSRPGARPRRRARRRLVEVERDRPVLGLEVVEALVLADRAGRRAPCAGPASCSARHARGERLAALEADGDTRACRLPSVVLRRLDDLGEHPAGRAGARTRRASRGCPTRGARRSAACRPPCAPRRAPARCRRPGRRRGAGPGPCLARNLPTGVSRARAARAARRGSRRRRAARPRRPAPPPSRGARAPGAGRRGRARARRRCPRRRRRRGRSGRACGARAISGGAGAARRGARRLGAGARRAAAVPAGALRAAAWRRP